MGVSEIRDGEDLWEWTRLEIRLNAFRRSIIPQKQFIIIKEAIIISLHFTIDFSIMCGKNKSFNEVLDVYMLFPE